MLQCACCCLLLACYRSVLSQIQKSCGAHYPAALDLNHQLGTKERAFPVLESVCTALCIQYLSVVQCYVRRDLDCWLAATMNAGLGESPVQLYFLIPEDQQDTVADNCRVPRPDPSVGCLAISSTT